MFHHRIVFSVCIILRNGGYTIMLASLLMCSFVYRCWIVDVIQDDSEFCAVRSQEKKYWWNIQTKFRTYTYLNPNVTVHPLSGKGCTGCILEWDRVCATIWTLYSHRLAIETGSRSRTPGNQRFCFVMVQTEKHVICFCPFSDHVLSQFDAVPFITNINKFFDSVDAGLVCCVWSCPFMNDVFWCDMLVYTMFVSLCYWQQCIMSLCPQILHFCQ